MRHAVAILLLGSVTWAFAQDAGQPRPGSGTPRAFGAASVKRNRSNGAGVPWIVAVQAGRLIAPYTTTRDLVSIAFGVDENQVIGGPDWVGTNRFEVNATVPDGTSRADAAAMLRELLADRFRLVVHRDTRELPVYALNFARGDRRLGDGMRRSGPECKPPTPPPGIPLPPPPPPPPTGINSAPPLMLSNPEEAAADGPRRPCGAMAASGHLSYRDIGFSMFVWELRTIIGRPVVDHTGVTGRFDIDLTYTPDAQQPGRPSFAPADAPALFTAIQEQLGLKLESTRAPVDVIVIDSVSPPTDN